MLDNQPIIFLPLHEQPLLLPAKPTMPLLAAYKATRTNPIASDYHGLTLYIATLEKDGTVNKLVVSYREKATGKLSKSAMGKLILRLAYSPKCSHDLPIDQPIPADVINATLDNIMPTLFLPKLFEEMPQLKTDMLSLAVLGPYALQRLQAFHNCEESTRIKQSNAMDVMLELWGNQPLCNITPENCAKDLLEQMPYSTAKECVRVLRQIFCAEYANVVKDPHAWDRYRLPRSVKTYSVTRVIRNRLLDNPLSAAVIADIVDISMQHITDPTLGGRYLGTLCLALEAISAEEACALTVGSLIELHQYPGKHALRVDHQINTHGSRSRCDGHIIDQSYTRDLIMDKYQNRDIGVCDIIDQAWSLYIATHNAAKRTLIMTNPINPDRVLSPNTYEAWLAAGFSEESALRSVGEKLTCACQAIWRNRYSEKSNPRTKKECMAEGVPGRMTMVNITIKIPPTISKRDLLLLLTSRLGFSAEISAI